MATETSTETVNDTPGETPDEVIETTTQEPESTPAEPAGNEEPGSTPSQQADRLPDDHPLVKAYTSSQDQLKQLKTTHQTKVQELEAKVTELTDQATQAQAVQAKYDRLEAFLTSLGGPVSKALDSKSFSTALFESDTDIQELAAQWHKDNPSATSQALSSGGGITASSTDMNSLLRSAAK